MVINAVISQAAGAWDDTRRHVEAGMARSTTDGRLTIPLTVMENRFGEFDSVERYLQLRDSGEVTGGGIPTDLIRAIGKIYGGQFEIPDEAEQVHRRSLDLRGLEPNRRGAALYTLGTIALVNSDSSLAAEVCATAEKLPAAPSIIMICGWLLPRLEWIAGRHDKAADAFEDVISFSEKAGYLPLWAESCTFYAESLLERGSAEDRARASDVIAAAIPVSNELGMIPMSAKLTTLSDEVSGSDSTLPDGLSERELDVLKLLAAGMSNQAIADELFVSRYTVIRHVSNIFGKTGCTSRSEAAIYAIRHQLAE